MNHLINVVNFYKIKKENDKKAINYFYNLINENYFSKSTRSIKCQDFSFIFFAKKNNVKNGCPLCIDNIYKNEYLRFIPIYLYDRFFIIQPSFKQYINNHIVIIDLIHIPHKIDNKTIDYFLSFIKQFPSFFICANNHLENIGGSVNEHLHYQAGIYDMPIFHKDAALIEDDIYEVEWYLKTFLIKSNNAEVIKEKYLYLLDKYQNEATSFNPVLFIRNEIYHLYMILRCAEEINIHNEYKDFKIGIGVFEVMGHFILNEQSTPPSKMCDMAKKMLSYKR